MPHREPTIRSRELGDGLRQAMEAAGLTGKQAAAMSARSYLTLRVMPIALGAHAAMTALTVPTPAWRAFLTTLTRGSTP